MTAAGREPGTAAGRRLLRSDFDTSGWGPSTVREHVHEAILAIEAEARQQGREREVALREIVAIHAATSGQGYMDGSYGGIDPCCQTCGTDDEYAVPWPCSTVLAARRALASADGPPEPPR